MTKPTLIQSKTSLPVSDIAVRDRLRPTGDAGVAAMIASIREIGQITSPINVRQVRRSGDIRYEMIDGAHRLAAAQELGWEEVPVRVFECNDDQARIMEIDGNLAGAELNALDTAVFLATRKAIYERLHPEAKQGGVRGNQHTGGWQTELGSFCQTAAEKMGITERQVRKIAITGSRLHADEINQLRLAPRPVTLADLQEISKIGEAPERYEVVRMLATGEAKGAAKARKAYLHRDNPPVHSDPIDAEFLAMRKLWDRAHKAAKIRLVRSLRKDLTEMLADLDEREGI